MTKHEQVSPSDVIERAKKTIDPVMLIFDLRLSLSRLRTLEILGMLDNADLEAFEKSYFVLRDKLIPDIRPGHVFWDEAHDGIRESGGITVGSAVEWQDEDRVRSGILIYKGRPFSRIELAARMVGWLADDSRAKFVKTASTARSRIKSPLRKLCMTGAIVRVETQVKGTGKRSCVYYTPKLEDLKVIS